MLQSKCLQVDLLRLISLVSVTGPLVLWSILMTTSVKCCAEGLQSYVTHKRTTNILFAGKLISKKTFWIYLTLKIYHVQWNMHCIAIW